QELAAGYSLGEGLGSTYHYLLKEKVKDWHLLRLYVRGDCPGALVKPLGDYHWQPPQLPQEQFLDPLTQEVRVATREEFVGRRRYLQRYLGALKGGKFLGVVIHGIGGVGKSTVAARLLERMPEYEPIFIYQELDEKTLINKLSRQTNEIGLEILQGNLPLRQRLTKFLQVGCNSQKQQLMFVLDDFEENMELRADGKPVLKPQVVEVVGDLLEAIAQSQGPHRVIITCRYDFTLDPTLNRRLYREQLGALRGADLRKKCQRLASFQPDSEVDANLQERAKNAADGNPRLLEWLNQILLTRSVAISEIITKMQQAEAEFRTDILAEELLNQQDKDLREMLRLGLVFQVPVPRAAFTEICSNIRNLETHITRAISLGLLESIQSTPADGELLRVPRLLPLLLPADDQPLHRQAAELLYQIWWEESENSTEERLIEIHRLALGGKVGQIAVTVGTHLTTRCNTRNRFREAAKMCQDTLVIIEDYRILHRLASSELKLGEVEKANDHYQQALNLCPSEDEREKAAILHNLGFLKANQGEIDDASDLYTQS
ncbi:MAG TPA: tetratricopeptide repeat protein, partial [Vampirovibrionales bacterium]